MFSRKEKLYSLTDQIRGLQDLLELTPPKLGINGDIKHIL